MLEAKIRELKGQNGELESDLAETAVRCTKLSTALEDQKAQASSIQNKFDAYKKEYKISGDLWALQTAVATMQHQLEERRDE